MENKEIVYTGIKYLTEEEAGLFYSDNKKFAKTCNIKENQYIIINKDEIYCYQDKKFRKVLYQTINNAWSGVLKPKNVEQRVAVDMVLDSRSAIKLITGTWGTGKTLILVTAALEAIENGRFDKIVWIRNNVAVKDTDALGALPGTELEKVLPYVMPMADHCGGISGIESLMQRNKLEVIPLGFLRGRSLKNSIILSSEAENLTRQHIQLLIGRIDEGSNLWMDADLKQRDRESFVKSQGIETMIDRLKNNPLFGYVHLVKSERSDAAKLADLLND